MTHEDLANMLYYTINRFTSFYCAIARKEVSDPVFGDSIPVTYQPSLNEPPDGSSPLDSLLPMTSWIGPTRGGDPLRRLPETGIDVDKIPKSLKPKIVTLALVDLRHGHGAREKDGLFSLSLTWMKCAYELAEGSTACARGAK